MLLVRMHNGNAEELIKRGRRAVLREIAVNSLCYEYQRAMGSEVLAVALKIIDAAAGSKVCLVKMHVEGETGAEPDTGSKGTL